jgi:predicted transcriptional regulator
MSTPNTVSGDKTDTDKASTRQRDLAYEAEMIAEAREQAAAGRTVSEEQVDAWIDSLGTEHELPPRPIR